MPSAITPSDRMTSTSAPRRDAAAGPGVTLLLQPERFHDRRDAARVFLEEGLELIAGQEPGCPPHPAQRLLPRRRFRRGLDELDQLVALRRREARCAEDAPPVAEHHVDALLLQRLDAVLGGRA